jgi:hypothetical protein
MVLHARQMREAGYHQCSTCLSWKERAAFTYRKRHCDECHREQHKELQFERRTGAVRWQFEDAIEEQQNKCAICKSPFVHSHRDPREPVQDHKRGLGEKKDQRTTGYPRGVLCRNCNNGLGLFGDESATLRAAAYYLDKWSKFEREREEERRDELVEED